MFYLFMDLLFEVPDDPPTFLDIDWNTFLHWPGLGDKPALSDGLVLALGPGHQVLHRPGHGHADLLLHPPALLPGHGATLDVLLDRRSQRGPVTVDI